MILGFVASALAALWKFMTKGSGVAEDHPLTRLFRLTEEINAANSEAELADAERKIDEILKSGLERYSPGEAEAAEYAALGLATQRLERLIDQRRAGLGGRARAAI
jgi:hypothetical protein